MFLHKRNLIILLLTLVTAHLVLVVPAPYWMQAVALLLIAGFVPGVLLVEALVGQSASRPDPGELVVYGLAAGYTVIVAVLLLLSYLPGGPAFWPLLLAFDAVTVLLLGWVLWRGRRVQPGAPVWSYAIDWRWLVAGAVVLLVVGALPRFANLGFTDFQGDEARAALRAAAVIQGYEDVLFLHKKGPTEILLPTLLLTGGNLTEATARLPFAIANLAALFAVWLLGWRLFNPLAGWLAAIFLALDGYFIGFARIVQYQSIVFLTSILVVLILYRLVQQRRAVTAYLTLAALLLATGMLSHYEGALAAIPAALFWAVLLWRNRAHWKSLLGSTVVAAGAGVLLLGAFYAPFVVHPRFAATFYYLTDRRIGSNPPYNNLRDVFLRTTLYNTTYAVALASLTLVGGLVRAFWRIRQRALAISAIVFTLLTTVSSAVNPEWLQFGGRDLTVLPFLLLILLVLTVRDITLEERVIWAWFGLVMLLAIFFTEKPRTHVYTFFMPGLLLVGQILSVGWHALAARVGFKPAAIAGVAAAVMAILVFGNYAFQYMASTREVLLNYDEARPAGYWTAYEEPDDKARFGFPLNNGWKVVGALMQEGVIDGYFDTSEKEAWVPAWYTQGIDRCQREADWYFEIRNLEPFARRDLREMEDLLRQGFEKWGRVQIEGRDKMIIYQRTGVHRDNPTQDPVDDLPIYHAEDYAAAFDAAVRADFPLTYPSVDPPIGNPLHVNFDNKIWLEGYDLDYPQPLRPGDIIRLTLYWRAQQPIEDSYKVFNQVYYGDGPMQAQLDGYPVCNGRTTDQWDPGELITDFYDIPVKQDAVDGLYRLNSGFYLDETGDRLPILDDAGNPVDTQWHVADIRIGEE